MSSKLATSARVLAGDEAPRVRRRRLAVGSVILHLPAAAVTPFAADGTVEELGPNRCRFTSGSWSWMALAASLGRFDAEIQVVAPPELAEASARLATRSARAAGSSRRPIRRCPR
ncbi:MAG TPA: hypothetical protein VNJ54_04730 [Plantibacter sp.]|uniref:hypothetical protein n=1 Tax=unclassified Plantibacter TaxID=2624265 RepID=UPI002C81FB99|nr:hypothetical protein [Plantibacter sp.]